MSDSSRKNLHSKPLLVIGLAIACWYFFHHFEINGLDQLAVHAKSQSLEDSSRPSNTTPSEIDWSSRTFSNLMASPVSAPTASESLPAVARILPETKNLRIATWALGGFGPDKLESLATIDRVAGIIRGFDVIAIQQLRATQRDFVPQLLDRASGDGRRYDYILGPTQEPSGEQLAFFFDTNRVVTDRTQHYTLADPDHRMSHAPLVGWFRASELDPNAAWTFTLVNVRVELPLARQETAELPRILSAISHDGRGEDDCILAGLFQADDVYLLNSLRQPALRTAIKGTPTDIFSRHQTSNLIFNNAMTTEAMGRGGIVDFLRRENLSLAEAEKVSPYLPVYAEFSIREGGVP